MTQVKVTIEQEGKDPVILTGVEFIVMTYEASGYCNMKTLAGKPFRLFAVDWLKESILSPKGGTMDA